MEAFFQQIIQKYDTDFEIARKYYVILFALNNLKITHKELDLVAYCAVHGTISTPPVRNEFMRIFNVPKNSVYNMISELKKLNILFKDKDNKIRINPQILPDFNKKELILAIKISKNVN